jgi:hypothetical protein
MDRPGRAGSARAAGGGCAVAHHVVCQGCRGRVGVHVLALSSCVLGGGWGVLAGHTHHGGLRMGGGGDRGPPAPPSALLPVPVPWPSPCPVLLTRVFAPALYASPLFRPPLLLPGTGQNPCLHLVMSFGAPSHPSSLGACPDDPLDAGPEWTPFDFTLSRFLHATGEGSGDGLNIDVCVCEGGGGFEEAML